MMNITPVAQFVLAVLAGFYLTTLLRRVTCIMANVQDIRAALENIQAGVDKLEAAIADLKTKVGSGSVATEADLQELADKAAAIGADIADTSDQGGVTEQPADATRVEDTQGRRIFPDGNDPQEDSAAAERVRQLHNRGEF